MSDIYNTCISYSRIRLFSPEFRSECSSPRTSRGDLRKLQKQSQRSTVKLYLTGRQSGRRRRARFSPVLSTHKAVSFLIFASTLLTNVKRLQFVHSAAPPPRRPFILQKTVVVAIQLPLIKSPHLSSFTHFPPPPRTRSSRVRPSQGVTLRLA